MQQLKTWLLWAIVVVVGVSAFATLALNRGESISAVWIIVAAVCVYMIAYRFYSLYIAKTVMQLDPLRMTPAERHNDGLDYVPTHKGVLFGHHFAAIGRACACGANGLFAWHAVDYFWGGVCRRGARHDGVVHFHAPRWQIAG